jgi:hypothetical protein
MKNKLFLGFMALMFAVTMVACQGTTTETPTTTAATTTQQTTTTGATTTAAPSTLDILDGFVSGWEGVYTTSLTDGILTVSYDKHNFAWPELVYAVEDDLSDFNKLTITASGEGTLLVRFTSATETFDTRFELTSVDVARQIDLRDIAIEDVTSISLIALPGQTTGTGEFVISGMLFEEGNPYGTVLELGLPEYDGTYDAWIQGDENAYTLTTQLDGTIKVDYVKLVDQSYLWMKSTFDAEAAAGFNTMTVTLKGTVGNTVLVKPNDSGALERSMTFTDENAMSLTFNASSFTSLVLFAQPGDATASTGSFYIVSVVLSYTEPTVSRWVSNDFIDGTWTYTDTLYDFTYADEVLTVDWDRGTDNAWNLVKYAFPEFLGNHNAIVLTVQGTAGVQIIVKPNDNSSFEKTITFDGTEQTFVFQMGVTPLSLLIFVDPIANSATGSFDILQAKTMYLPSGTMATTQLVENDGGTYTVTAGDDLWTNVEYMKAAGQEWVFAINTFDAEEVGDNNTMLVVLRGTAGKQVLLKPNNDGTLEHWVTFTDDQPVFVWYNIETITSLLVFAEGGTAPATGSFQILGVFFSYTQPEAVDRDVVVDFTTGWYDNGGDMYTITEVDGTSVIAYDKVGGEWNNIKYVFADNLANHNTLTFVIQGTAGKQILIKPNDKNIYENWITLTGEVQTIVITLPEAPVNCIIFAEPGVGTASGSFTIVSAEATWEPVPVTISEGWSENDPGTYAITVNGDGSVTVDYTKTADQSWIYMINTFDADTVAGLNTMTIVIQGTDGKTLLVKPNDNGAIEVLENLDGTEQTFVFTSEAGFSKLLLFAEGGTSGVSGTFTIVSLTLSYVAPES